MLAPPLGSILIGPCPQCEELVAIFCGQALPLDKDVMLHGSQAEKQEHLRSVLIDFITDRIAELLPAGQEEAAEALEADGLLADDALAPPEHRGGETPRLTQISESEVCHFVQHELALLDDQHSFRALFE